MKTELVVFLIVAMAIAVPSFGQTFGGITGVVMDSSGSVVVGATVTVTNPQTNLSRTAASNDAGN